MTCKLIVLLILNRQTKIFLHKLINFWQPSFFFFLYIKMLIYNITHETKKSQSPGTENLRCLGIQKKERKREKKKKLI